MLRPRHNQTILVFSISLSGTQPASDRHRRHKFTTFQVHCNTRATGTLEDDLDMAGYCYSADNMHGLQIHDLLWPDKGCLCVLKPGFAMLLTFKSAVRSDRETKESMIHVCQSIDDPSH